MRKKIVIILSVLYLLGLGSAIIVMTSNLKNNENEDTNKNPITSITLSKKQSMIGVINIDEPISFNKKGNTFLPSVSGADYWLQQMQNALTNKQIKAVIIRVNTPGGAVGASQELHAAVQKIQQAGKPVIVSVGDISASGGYYVTASADKMFANGGSIVGSIGVIMSGIEYSDLLTKLGVTANVIKSGKNKDILSPFKKMEPEQKALLQASVMDAYEQFLNVVVEGRKLSVEKIRPLADGRIFTGHQAVSVGLIDEVGTFEDAVEFTRTNYNLQNATLSSVAVPMAPFKLSELLPTAIAKLSLKSDIRVSLPESATPYSMSPILYLYQQ